MQKQYVSNKDESARLFKSDLLEVFTHVHPAIPHLIFIPLVGFMIYLSAGMGLTSFAFLFVFGVCLWTLAEYTIHRFLFHFKPRNPWQQRVHFLIHAICVTTSPTPIITLGSVLLFGTSSSGR
jgi:4-hydroxysphinganine ceramide fatty acyl 2-hydroxylase